MEEPKYLYKYRYFDKDGYHLDILRNLELYFASPSELNDPFDCKIVPRFDLMTRQEMDKFVEKIIRQKIKNIHPNKVKKEAKRISSNWFKSKTDYFSEYIKDHDEHMNSNYGIYSFSRSKNNNALWTNYGDEHKGFLIEFDFKKLSFALNTNEILNSDGWYHQESVVYEQDMPVFKPQTEEGDYSKKYKQVLCTKGEDWRYETEYRLILYSFKTRIQKIPKESIIKVIAGAKIKPENLKELERICQEQNLSLCFGKKEFDSFKIKY